MSKVSVVIPFYNTDKEKLENCLQSIMNSDYLDLEVIIINDGSNKMYGEVLNSTLKKITDKLTLREYPPLKLYCQKNAGPSSARNFGLQQAKGEYILFVDSDDFVSEDYIGALVRCIEEFNADIAYSSMQMTDEEGNPLKNKMNSNKYNFSINISEVGFMEIINRMWNLSTSDNKLLARDGVWLSMCVGGKLYKKSVIGGVFFDENLVNGEDQIFTYDALKKAERLSFTNTGCYFYRESGDSLQHLASTKTIDKYIAFIEALQLRLKDNGGLFFNKAYRELMALVKLLCDNSTLIEYVKLMNYMYSKEKIKYLCKNMLKPDNLSANGKCLFFMIKHQCKCLIYFARLIHKD